MFWSILNFSNKLLQTITQSFYIALSHISIRTHDKISVGVLFIRGRNKYKGASADGSAGGAHPKLFDTFFDFTVPKIVAHCRKRVIPYLYTLRRTIAYAYTLPIAIAYFNTCITYPNTLTRLSALGSIS